MASGERPRWPDGEPMATPPASARIDTANKHVVARHRDQITIIRPPLAGSAISEADALNLAAWLVAMVEGGPEKFAAVLRAICNT